MDPASIVLPGAQSLVTQILSDGWAQVRGWLAQRWSRHSETSQAELEHRLDDAKEQAASLFSGERTALEAYWAGYLAALISEHPGLAASLQELPAHPSVSNTVSGTVTGNVVQAGTIEGGITFGPPR